jgi:hypothetical protein
MEDSECLLDDDNEALMQHSKTTSDENNDITAKHDGGIWELCCGSFATFAEVRFADLTLQLLTGTTYVTIGHCSC